MDCWKTYFESLFECGESVTPNLEVSPTDNDTDCNVTLSVEKTYLESNEEYERVSVDAEKR